MTANRTDMEMRKKNMADVVIILLVSAAALAGYIIFMKLMGSSDGTGTPGEVKASGTVILLQTLIGALTEFSIWGLGISIVCAIRKESFVKYGLIKSRLFITLILSALVCIPSFVNILLTEGIHSYLPFQAVHFTKMVLAAAFPVNVIGMAIIASSWGFFEGFTYVIISDKINRLVPVKYIFFNWGAIICGIACLLVHAAIGLTPDTWIAGLCDFIIIYGMLLVRDYTGNAWGCVFIYFFFWNAFV